MLAAPARKLEGAVGDAGNLAFGVGLGIPDLALAIDHALTALAEVDAAGEFAHDQHVGALNDLRPQGRECQHLGIDDHGTQVHEEVESAAEAEDRRRLDAAPLRVVELARRPAEGALEDRVGGAAGVDCDGGQVLAVALPCFAAGIRFDELELVAEAAADRLQHAQRFVDDLGADAVALEDGDP